jgi:hypothetical protein
VLRRSLIVVVVSLVASCGKGNPPPQQMPENTDDTQPKEPLKGDPGHVTNVGRNYAPDITLPRGTGAAPVATTAPIPGPKLHALGAIEFPGFRRSVTTDDGTVLEVQHTLTSRPHLRVTVRIEPCGPNAECTKMDLAQWRAKGDALKAFLTKKLLAAADTTFDVESSTLNGATLIGTYQLGLDAATDSNGNPFGDATSAYIAYYNDGANSVRIIAEYRDDLPKSIKALEGYAPRATVKMMATRFLDYFTQNWGG